jgi:plasmid stabilization system protein ParE
MRRFEIRIAERAMREIRRISRSWRRHRRAAPLLFDRELEAILELMESYPDIGTRRQLAGVGDVRVVVLRKSRYLVAYQVVPMDEQVWIVRVRHASRRPVLRRR